VPVPVLLTETSFGYCYGSVFEGNGASRRQKVGPKRGKTVNILWSVSTIKNK